MTDTETLPFTAGAIVRFAPLGTPFPDQGQPFDPLPWKTAGKVDHNGLTYEVDRYEAPIDHMHPSPIRIAARRLTGRLAEYNFGQRVPLLAPTEWPAFQDSDPIQMMAALEWEGHRWFLPRVVTAPPTGDHWSSSPTIDIALTILATADTGEYAVLQLA